MPAEKDKDADKGPVPWYKQLLSIRDTIIIIATPIVLLPIIFVSPTRAARCAYTIVIMAVYWMTEALPMAVTALLPIVLFPWLGVLGSKTICTNYLKDANMLFFGGLLVAIAVEKWDLHKRIALRVLLLVGSKPIWIILGFMVVTAFLSMWLNNTATTAMMMPIAQAVLTELDNNRKRQLEAPDITEATEATVEASKMDSKVDVEMEPIEKKEPSEKMEEGDGGDAAKVAPATVEDGAGGNGKQPHDEKIEATTEAEAETDPLQSAKSAERLKSDKHFMSFRKTLKLSVPYASTIGGIATIIGCGPNIILKGQLDAMYKDADTGISFTSWLVIGFPQAVLQLFLTWILMMVLFFGFKETFRRNKSDESDNSANEIIQAEYVKLGKFTFAEYVVLTCFIILALLWFFRKPEFIRGWDDYMLQKGFVTDASVAISMCVLLFILPSQFPNYLCFRRANDKRSPGVAKPILDWPTVHKQMPWSVIILLGGGFALADACKESGLSASIGVALASFKNMPVVLMVTLMCIIATIITSFTSNMATTTIFIPILAEVSSATCVNPLYLMLPVTFAASFAYILPVSTPPNAIAYAYGDVTILDMIKAGILVAIICNLCLLLVVNTYGYGFFNLGTFPEWAGKDNNCTSATTLRPATTVKSLNLTYV